jgi:predicted N-acetyltransferase YhbS
VGELYVGRTGSEVFAGRVELTRVALIAGALAGFGAGELLQSDESVEEYADLFDRDGKAYLPTIKRSYEITGELAGDLFCFGRVEILPALRGAGLALRFYQLALAQFSQGCRFAVLKPFPLQLESRPELTDQSAERAWRAQLALEALPRNRRQATAKLRQYYGRIGFTAVRGTPLMLLDLRRAPVALTRPT